MKPEQFKEDPRFSICFREMVISYGIQIVFTLYILSVVYGLGGKPLSEYTFILGMPSWWFLTLLGSVIFIAFISFVSLKVFQEIDVDAYLDEGKRG